MKRGFTLIELLVVIAIVGILAAVIIAGVSGHRASACGFFTSCDSATNQKAVQTETTNEQLSRLTNATPIPRLESSLERTNISKRLTTFSDPSKVSYIYLVSFGKVMAFYTVKGKVTSGSKRLTASDQLIDNKYTQDQYVTQAPELDGTYGSSADYIFFWTTDGVYVQWNGEYMQADQPLQLTTAPELVRSVK